MSSDIQVAAERAVTWLKTEALPLWAEAGFVAGPDFFCEALDFAGRPVPDLPVRSRVQGRQMTVFGHATLRGWFDGRELLARVFERGYEAFRDPDGGYVAAIRPDRSPHDATRFAYEQAFALLGFAWHERVFRSGEAKARAEALWRWLEERLAVPRTGGFLMGLPRPAGPLSQNPHMHLLEACLALYATTGEGVWLDRAAAMVDLFERHFFDRAAGVVREFFADDLSPTVPDSARIDPGHQAEWVWLLAWYRSLAGAPVAAAIADLHLAMERGRNPRTGLLVEEMTAGGTPLVATSRLWSATELLKAAIARYEMSNRTDGAAAVVVAADLIFERHLAGVRPGLWMDKVDAEGRPLSANVPASTLYHLVVAFAELDRVTGGVEGA
jgi:mannose-6-phosphate isomerase